MTTLAMQLKEWSSGRSLRRRIGWLIVALIIAQGLYWSVRRFFFGLGAVTNLKDHFPWGFWIGFDVMGGVALAAGGFTLCCLVYVFGYHRYHSIVRPTVLTAFLGYILVAVGLMYDLGKYFNILHPVVYWNLHSVMLEVAWCVMLYLAVLFLEFLPVVFEKFRMGKALRTMQKASIPIVLAGVILSTLHQSSLGSLFLIVPEKLHPLWYTPILPVLFFLSAVAVGPAMVIVESCFSARLFRRGLELPILADLSRFLLVAVILYMGVRVQDIYVRGVQGDLFAPGFETFSFWLENLLFIIPIVVLSIPGMRERRPWLPLSAFSVVAGVVWNRLNVCWVGMIRQSGTTYVPRISEVLVSVFLVTVGALAFYLIGKYFPVFPELEAKDNYGASCLKVDPAPQQLRSVSESE